MLRNHWLRVLACCAVFGVPLTVLSVLYAADCEKEEARYVECPDKKSQTRCGGSEENVPCGDQRQEEVKDGNFSCGSSNGDKTRCVKDTEKIGDETYPVKNVCWIESRCVEDEVTKKCGVKKKSATPHLATVYKTEECKKGKKGGGTTGKTTTSPSTTATSQRQ